MAILLSYCNAAHGKTVEFTYNPDTQAISASSLGGACSSGALNAGEVIHQHTQGGTTYYVRALNTAPYAYVDTFTPGDCLAAIDSIIVGDASNSAAADGSIIINGSGNGLVSYSIDGGLTWHYTNVFNDLVPGTYICQVKNFDDATPLGGECYSPQEDAIVGYNDLVCELELGNISVTQPSAPGEDDGSISINTITNPPALPVEYRLDAGAWQDSPVFNGLETGVYNVQVRYKDFPACGDNRNVTIVEDESCDIIILGVHITNEQSKFGDNGSLLVNAQSSSGPIEYSIDNGDNYQESNNFLNLEPGAYHVRVKDAFNCEDDQIVTVLPYKAPYVDIAEINSHRFVLQSGPVVDKTFQNFHNTLFAEMKFPGVPPCTYHQLFAQGDVTTTQFKSNYANHTLNVIRESDDQPMLVIPVQKVKSLTRQPDSRTIYLTDAGANKTQIFFENGLPDWAKVGQDITISGSGHAELNSTFEIAQILPGVLLAAGSVVVIINVIFPAAGIVSGTATVEYDIEPYDVFEFVLNMNTLAYGKYYLALQGTDPQFLPFTAESEPFHYAESHSDSVHIKHFNTDNTAKVLYDTGITHIMRFEGDVRWPTVAGREVNHEDGKNRMIKLMEVVNMFVEMNMPEVPPYLAIRLGLICGQDHVVINGIDYGKQDEQLKIEHFEGDALCNTTVKLRLTEFNNENSDDGGDVDTPQTVLEINGTLMAINP